ncbi:MAG: tetratricopeptide repeat protein [Methylococcaceae bacterium]|nr:tetratricopeptide repeat protein [Methylococcaceae bacterium]
MITRIINRLMKGILQRTDNSSYLNFTLSHDKLLLVFLVLFVFAPTTLFAACVGAVGENAVNSCRQELGTNPYNLEARLALATTLDKLGRKAEAIKVLNQGMPLFQDDAVSKSTLEEKRWVIQQQRGKRSTSNAAVRVKIIKCTKLKGKTALKACDEGLLRQPENTDLLVGRGKALLDLAPPKVIDAIYSYKKALSIAPSNQDIKRKLEYAENIRQISVSACMKKSGKAALSACNRALLKGAIDEASIQARRGKLLAAINSDKKASVAKRLKTNNKPVKQANSQIITVKQNSSRPLSSSPSSQITNAPPVVARTFSNAPLLSGITY